MNSVLVLRLFDFFTYILQHKGETTDFLSLAPVSQITHISFLLEICITNIEIRHAVYVKNIAVVQKVSRWSLTADTWFRSLASICDVCGRVAVKQDFLEIFWPTPVSTIQPMLRTHSFVYHRHCKIIVELNITFHVSELVWGT
jgi:amino acid permease